MHEETITVESAEVEPTEVTFYPGDEVFYPHGRGLSRGVVLRVQGSKVLLKTKNGAKVVREAENCELVEGTKHG